VNFGVLYGMSVHGLMAAANMTFPEASRSSMNTTKFV